MRKILFLICFLLYPFILQAAQVSRGPYLEDPTQSTMVLRWQTDVPTPAWLEYGPAPRCNQIMTISPEGRNHKVVLYGLVPNQDFCYRLYVYNRERDGAQEPITGTFRTLFSAERKIVNFLVMGATGEPLSYDESGNLLPSEADAARESLASLMETETSDFVIHTGNITASGLNIDANREFFTPFKEVLRKTPLFVALGPNEYGPNRADRESKPFLANNYTRFHSMPWSNATPKYYSFDTANARFVFLDTNIAEGAAWAPDLDEKSNQIAWLKTTLAGAGERWRIVVMNAPAYSSGARGPNNEVFADLVKIFEDYRVNLVIQGGDANYERTFPMFRGEIKPRGVTYLTLGTAGQTPTKRTNPDASTARFVSARHYAAVKIVDRKLSVKIYNEKGKTIDEFDQYL
ncbi:MAG: metallophosphoesterase [Elusimicrobiaceae bacterium]|nr:metallophosphoesterase [Elusimicrobiaceae bacterium]